MRTFGGEWVNLFYFLLKIFWKVPSPLQPCAVTLESKLSMEQKVGHSTLASWVSALGIVVSRNARNTFLFFQATKSIVFFYSKAQMTNTEIKAEKAFLWIIMKAFSYGTSSLQFYQILHNTCVKIFLMCVFLSAVREILHYPYRAGQKKMELCTNRFKTINNYNQSTLLKETLINRPTWATPMSSIASETTRKTWM